MNNFGKKREKKENENRRNIHSQIKKVVCSNSMSLSILLKANTTRFNALNVWVHLTTTTTNKITLWSLPLKNRR